MAVTPKSSWSLAGRSIDRGHLRKVAPIDGSGCCDPTDAVTAEIGRSLGVGGVVTDAKVVGSTLWVATQTQVVRVSLIAPGDKQTFAVAHGLSAGSIAVRAGCLPFLGRPVRLPNPR